MLPAMVLLMLTIRDTRCRPNSEHVLPREADVGGALGIIESSITSITSIVIFPILFLLFPLSLTKKDTPKPCYCTHPVTFA
jgi:hypothetical protein